MRSDIGDCLMYENQQNTDLILLILAIKIKDQDSITLPFSKPNNCLMSNKISRNKNKESNVMEKRQS